VENELIAPSIPHNTYEWKGIILVPNTAFKLFRHVRIS
jgi:hypothetical protein